MVIKRTLKILMTQRIKILLAVVKFIQTPTKKLTAKVIMKKLPKLMVR